MYVNSCTKRPKNYTRFIVTTVKNTPLARITNGTVPVSRQKRKTLKHPHGVPNFLRVSRNIRPFICFKSWLQWILISSTDYVLHFVCDTDPGWWFVRRFDFMWCTKVNININSTTFDRLTNPYHSLSVVERKRGIRERRGRKGIILFVTFLVNTRHTYVWYAQKEVYLCTKRKNEFILWELY